VNSTPSALLLDLTGPAEAPWRRVLDELHPPWGRACDSHNLVQCTNSAPPSLLVCLAPTLDASVEAALAAWGGAPPFAVLLLTPPAPIDGPLATRAGEIGLHHWQWLAPDTALDVAAATLASAAAMAQARHRQDAALRRALARAHAQLDERRCVDRAKGVLMSARGLDEGEAFALLRSAAMNVNLRLGEVSRSVVDAAQWADAMNRAGQLRMLSQRLVRLVAQRLLRLDTRAASDMTSTSIQRVQDNLAVLARQCSGTSAKPALETASRAWQALAAALTPARAERDALPRIDALAERLLASGEQLTESLQQACGRRALHIVNLCGRQRMRVQRIAKVSLLVSLAGSQEPSPTLALLDDFDAAQRELECTPLRSAEISQALAAIADDWLLLLAGVRDAASPDGRRALVHASDRLLERFEGLTAAYEHSLQVIMG